MKFNPNIPNTNDPNYLGYSHPISQPESDKSLGSLFSGIGNLFEGAVKGVDTIIKQNLSEEIRDKTYPEREQHEAGLEYTYDAVKGLKGQVAQARAQSDVLGGGADEPVPPSVEDGLKKIGLLEGGRARGLSETYYLGRLNAIAKELRSQHPGYREYIDKEIKEVTGRDPANAYVHSLISDINSYANTKDKEKEKINALMLQHKSLEIPGLDAQYALYNADKVSANQIVSFMNRNIAQEADIARAKARLELAKANREDTKATLSISASIKANQIAANAFENLPIALTGTNMSTSEFSAKILSGAIKLDDTSAQVAAENIDRNAKTAEALLIKHYNETFKDPTTGKITSAAAILGPEETKKQITEHMGFFELMKQAFKDKDTGAIHSHANFVKAAVEDSAYGLITDKNVGKYTLDQAAFTKYIPSPEAQRKLYEYFIGQDMDNNFKEFLKDRYKKAVTGTTTPTARPTTISSDLDDLSRKKNENPAIAASSRDVSKVSNEITRLPGLILSNKGVTDEGKMNAIKYAFDPSNRAVLDKLEVDYTDSKGKPVAGRYAVFRRLTSEDITKEISRLDKLYPDQGLMSNYVNWAEESFGNSLFRRELAEFKEFKTNMSIDIGWDNENKQFVVKSNKPINLDPMAPSFGGSQQQYAKEELNRVTQSVNRLNIGLGSMKQIAEASGRNVDAYLLNKLMSMPGMEGSLDRVQGLPTMIFRAIVNSRGKELIKGLQQEKDKKSWQSP